MKLEKPSKDWAGLKFEIMKDFGECIDIVFIKKQSIDSPKDSDEFYIIPHSKADGISAILKFLEKVFGVKKSNLPIVKITKKPFLLRRLFLAYKHLKRQSPQKYIYKNDQKNIKGAPAGLCYFIFNEEQTNKLNAYCLKEKVSINSLLLYALDKVTQLKILKHEQKRVWMMPVNIRDQDHKKYRTGNHVTTLSVHLEKFQKYTPTLINKQIREQLKSGIIWGGKIIANAPKFIGEKRLRKIGANVKSPYIGLCSNIGSWPNLYEDLNEKQKISQHIIVAPPATSFCPVALAIMTWNECLTLCLELHPSLSQNMNETQHILKNIILEICSLSAIDYKLDHLDKIHTTIHEWYHVKQNSKNLEE